MSDHEQKQTERIHVPLEALRQWVADCNPREPIDSSDPRYFDFGRVPAEDATLLRGDYRIESLLDSVDLMTESCQLFSGFRGTGKSTELRRLAREFEQRGYAVLLVDAEDYHDLHRELVIEDLLVIVAGAFGDATGERLGKDVVTRSYWQRFLDFLKQEVKVSEAKLRVGIANLKVNIRHDQPMWRELRKDLHDHLAKLQEDVHGFIRGCVRDLQRAEPKIRGVVFIVDSLEKLEPPLGRFREFMASVLHVFSAHGPGLRLPDCHCVYSVPPYVQLVSPLLAEHYDRVGYILPAVKVRQRGITVARHEPGIEALIGLVERRIPVDQVFGRHRDRLVKLVEYTGGHVRLLITFLRELLTQANSYGLPPSDEDVERVIQKQREPARMKVGGVPGALILERIAREGRIEKIPENLHHQVAGFMDSRLVLCYRNADDWYQVHPLVHEFVLELAAEAKDEPT